MNNQTEQLPVLPAASWNWETVEEAIEEYIHEHFGVSGTLDGEYRSGRDRVQGDRLEFKQLSASLEES